MHQLTPQEQEMYDSMVDVGIKVEYLNKVGEPFMQCAPNSSRHSPHSVVSQLSLDVAPQVEFVSKFCKRSIIL